MPAITKPNLHFDATLYTGNGTAQSITNAGGFQPDLVWGKDRTNIANHGVIDVNRGISNWLGPNATNAEGVVGGSYVTAFNSNGFTVGTGGVYNASGDNYVAWQWKAGGTPVTNTSGTISSQVSVNTTAGFSIVTYTGTGSIATIGHGLGVAPAMMIIKARNAVQGWLVYHQSIGNTGFVYLNTTDVANYSINGWNNTSPTSTVFTTGVNGYTNASSQTQVAYCWAPVAGFSQFGSYTGNGSTDGPFIYTGFRPKLVIIKCTSDAGQQWLMLDTSRSTYNVAQETLFPDSSGAEQLNPRLDFLSNGIKIRNTYGNQNTNGSTYVYACFAENPLKYSNAR